MQDERLLQNMTYDQNKMLHSVVNLCPTTRMFFASILNKAIIWCSIYKAWFDDSPSPSFCTIIQCWLQTERAYDSANHLI